MANLNRKGLVYANGVLAGEILEYRAGLIETFKFVYDHEYVKSGVPIGHRFPIEQLKYEFDILPPFFTNLLSEGWVKFHQSSKARLDRADEFGLLLANGAEIIGAISIIKVEVND
ncbi:HipA N-terminal domain-containing protein [Thalassotalea sp. ND16A]|uniref:HipA N-terminal domain-containing protein n=1 Tax=Thalassotalea sp. ND16A TaxID=1535422 RepID=UPI00051A7318|nr:HipA N-terminal domain-containing protein [Thalassotalea sp. ND16A]KGK00538.1 hypothetical protein ND16A_3298 [Thalassotalea sp. ND16A]